MQVSPSGMAAASQAASGEFDSRHLLQLKKHPIFFSGVFYLRFSHSANAEENLSIFRHLLQNPSLKKARDFFIKSAFS